MKSLNISKQRPTSVKKIKWDFSWKSYKNLTLPGIWDFENTSQLPGYKYVCFLQHWDRSQHPLSRHDFGYRAR